MKQYLPRIILIVVFMVVGYFIITTTALTQTTKSLIFLGIIAIVSYNYRAQQNGQG